MNKIKSSLIVILCILCFSAILGVVVPLRNVNDKNANNESVDFSTLTYTAIGDSITYGYEPILKEQMENPYCDVVGEILGLKDVYNLGISGSTIAVSEQYNSQPMVNRYNKASKESNIISVMGGINDFGKNIPVGTINDNLTTTFYGALKRLAFGLKNNYSNAYIFFITPLINVGTANGELLPYVQAVKDVCEMYELDCLDAYSLSGFENFMYDIEKDGTHPTQEFHKEHLAPLIAQFIKDNYKK